MSEPIIPTRIFPAGEALPAPPDPPVVEDPDPDWFGPQSGPSGPPPTVEIHHHHYPAEPAGGELSVPDPDSGPPWYRRIRIGYNAGCAAVAFALCGPWAWVLASVRDEESLAGAWVMALIPLLVLGVLDNARRVEALCAHPELWRPRALAAVTRTALWTAVIATCLTLPVTTLVYAVTGVKPA